jgi:imidazolonepropionase-like amidohydrolase
MTRARTPIRATLSAILFFATLAVACSASAASDARGFAVEHVTILSMTERGAPIEDGTVVVRNGRITAIGRIGHVRVPRGFVRFDGSGKWLMPGLADMHVHTLNRGYGRELPGGKPFPAEFMRTQDVMLPFIANGVTQVLEMSALPETLEQIDEIESGAALGPRIAAAAMLDGRPPIWALNARVATTPDEGRRAVREIAAAGFSFVKVYSRLEIPVFEAVLDEARSAKVRVIGHVPSGAQARADSVLRPGFSMVAHAEEFSKLERKPTDADIARYATLCREHEIWMATTLTTNVWIARQSRDPGVVASASGIQYIHPGLVDRWLHANQYTGNVSAAVLADREELLNFNRRLVQRFVAGGVPIVAGTDAVIPGVVYGFSIHDELKLLVDAGLTNQHALESATRLPAEFLQVDRDRGTIEVGKSADFIVLDANPLTDIANTRTIAAVVIRGRYLPRSELDAMMRDLATRYAAMSGLKP